MDRSVAAAPPPPQASASSWRTRGCRARPLSAANRCRVKKSAKCQTSICTLGRSLRCAWREVCRWITYTVAILVRKQFILGAKSLPYGTPGNSTPLASYCVETVRNSVRVTQKLELLVSARPSVAKNDEHRVGVWGGRFEWGIGSAIKISCPSFLGPNWFQKKNTDFLRKLRKNVKRWRTNM